MNAISLLPYLQILSSLSISSTQTTTRVAFSSLKPLQLYTTNKIFKSSSSPFSTSPIQRRSLSVGASSFPSNMEPPKPKKVKHEMEMFGDVRVDDYYWLRDDSRSNPEILAHLRQENAYVDHMMSGPFMIISHSLPYSN